MTASSACPTVWPKFNTRRSPPSRSSVETIPALMRHDSAITRESGPSSRAKSAGRISKTSAKSVGLAITLYLITLYNPARNSRRGKVASTDGSAITRRGG